MTALTQATLAQEFLNTLSGALSHNPAAEVEAHTWQQWVEYFFPRIAYKPFGDHHKIAWEWAWSLQKGKTKRPLVCIWPRGGAKSSTAEMIVAMLGATGRRKYILYVRSSQEQANGSISNISSLLQSPLFTKHYPDVAKPMINNFGQRRSWRQNRMITNTGFTVDAFGLDAALRGVKVDEMRPDMIIFDDIDEKHDSSAVIDKKIKTITTSIMPAGSSDAVILAVQNLIRMDGFFGQMASGDADYMRDAQISGPIPAIYDLEYEEQWDDVAERQVFKITNGQPSWEGQDIETSEIQMSRWGLSAFLIEAQHEINLDEGGTFQDVAFQHCSLEDCPDFRQVVVWCDPAVTDSDASDSQGIQIDALGTDNVIYRLWSYERRTSPKRVIETAIVKGFEYGATEIGIETDQGGDLWFEMYRRILEELQRTNKIDPDWGPKFASAKGGSIGSKRHRQDIHLAAYDRFEIVHVKGTHHILEAALKRFPVRKPYDLADAAFWAYNSLRKRKGWVRGSAE